MLDKSIPYFDIIMRLDKNNLENITKPSLPEGYKFKMYSDGDEKHWADIETSVLEFDNSKDAVEYFKKEFFENKAKLYSRCVFILDKDDNYVATSTSWFTKDNPSMLHWVSVKPGYQGQGLGKSVVQKCLEIYKLQTPQEDVTLHTQTWSHTAVSLYLALDFYVLKKNDIKKYEDKYKYEKATEILKSVLPEEKYEKLIATAK